MSKSYFDRVLEARLTQGIEKSRKVGEAAVYSTMGGKRYRAFVGRMAYSLQGGNHMGFLGSALGIECIHGASLIFDDSDHFDNSPLRKGKTATHIKFGSAIADLTGLYLTEKGRQFIIQNASSHLSSNEEVAEISDLIAEYSTGLISGQEIDVSPERDERIFRELMHKKNILFEFACVLPAYLLKKKENLPVLKAVGSDLSFGYQLLDDLRDELGDVKDEGKPVRSDGLNYVKFVGVEKARKELKDISERTIANIRMIRKSSSLEHLVSKIFGYADRLKG